jgi:phosphoserine aminotransferase
MSSLLSVHRVLNFSPGPAALPTAVLLKAQEELLSLRGSGMSILEISHRSPLFEQILAETIERLGSLLKLPAGYRVLFLQGGARLQFSMIPMNFAPSSVAQYLVTGTWGKFAAQEAKKVAKTEVLWDGGKGSYRGLPTAGQYQVNPEAAYLYYTSNETIQGVQFPTEPDAGGVPLFCDASSDFLSRPLPMEKYGLLYACAQKNAGPAGVTIVIVREDLFARCQETLPGYLNFQNHAEQNSLYNTPATFAIYVVGLVAEWLVNEIGGLEKMQALNLRKSKALYDVIDESHGFYQGHAEKNCRSMMNVTFKLETEELQDRFLKEADTQELFELKGHRSVGGIRASLYNAMPWEGAERLRDFMLEFRNRYAK